MPQTISIPTDLNDLNPHPGPPGSVLQSQGPTANPIWAAGVGTGVVPADLASATDVAKGPALVGYKTLNPAGNGYAAGAVARTLQAKLVEVAVSPEDFGAVGDGVTNDGNAINAAVAALPASGGTVYLRAKSYAVVNPLAGTKANVTFVGAPGATLQRLTGGGQPAIMGNAYGTYDRWSFREVAFNTYTSANDAAGYVAQLMHCDRGVSFERCSFRSKNGFYLSGVHHIHFRECDFYGTNPGVMAAGVQDPSVNTAAAFGIGCRAGNGCSDIDFDHCRFHFCYLGITGLGPDSLGALSRGMRVRDCEFRGDWWHNPYITLRFTPTDYNLTTKVITASGADFTGHFGDLQTISIPVPVATGSAFAAEGEGHTDGYVAAAGTPFATAQVGDSIETSDGRRAEVLGVLSNHELTISGWEAVDTFEPCAPPAIATAWRLTRYYATYGTFLTATTIQCYMPPVCVFTGKQLVEQDALTPVGIVCSELGKTSYSGFFLYGGWENILIEGNRFRGSWADQCSIEASSDVKGVRIIGNDFCYHAECGIVCTGQRAVILGNTFHMAGGPAIFIGNCHYSSIIGNTVSSWACNNHFVQGAIEGNGKGLMILGNTFTLDRTYGYGGASNYCVAFWVSDSTGSLVSGNFDGGARLASLFADAAAAPSPHAIQARDFLTVAGAGAPNVDFGTPYLKGGYLATRQNSPPADAILLAGDLTLWFDQTNGAPRLRVKARQADGTVCTGSLALTGKL